jgi:hypothetical protein
MIHGKPPSVLDSDVVRALTGGDSMSTAEVRFSYTDFFDTSNDAAAPYFAHTLNTEATLINNGSVSVARRILGADLWICIQTAEVRTESLLSIHLKLRP